MNAQLAVLVARRGGWFCRADALACGYTEGQVRARLTDGRWRRLCRDGYVEVAREPDAEPRWKRTARLHRLAAAAVLRRISDSAVASHQTAVLLHGLPTWQLDLSRVHVTKPAGRSRSTADVVIHHAEISRADTTVVDRLAATVPARAVVEAACGSTYEAAVVLFDAALAAGLVSPQQLTEVTHRLRHCVGSPHATNAARVADGRSESVGESRLRVLMLKYGLPAPDLQVDLFSADDHLVGRVDFLFRAYDLVVEFDGALKYTSGGDVVAEKWREDRIRALGFRVLRFGWADLAQPNRTAHRLTLALGTADRVL